MGNNLPKPTIASISYTKPVRTVTRLPKVDWRRYHVDVLVVDQTDTIRARVATGLLEKIASWNGYGRSIYPYACGLEAQPEAETPLSTLAALMFHSSSLGIPEKHFARPCERFEIEDLNRYDLIVAVDRHVYERLKLCIDVEHSQSSWYNWYNNKVWLLTDFSLYPGEAVLRKGGLALLPRKFSGALEPLLEEILEVVDIESPQLTDAEEGARKWNFMVTTMILAAAGLVKYLIDSIPEDLPDYDPL